FDPDYGHICKAVLHVARRPAKAHPLMRRLSAPGLCDRDQVCIAVVVKSDETAERVGDVCKLPLSIVVNAHVVAVAILNLRTVVFVVCLSKGKLRAVSRTYQQGAASLG